MGITTALDTVGSGLTINHFFVTTSTCSWLFSALQRPQLLRLTLTSLGMVDMEDMEAMQYMEDMAWDTLGSKAWDMLGMEDMVVMAMLLLSTMGTTMLLTPRCPPLPPFLSLDQPLLLSLE